jgi:hypothetical protein
MGIYASFIAGGGFACIQHFALRVVLHFSFSLPNDPETRCIPWNYAKFLDYASERKLIQRVGGRYRFIHRLLLTHFAAMP